MTAGSQPVPPEAVAAAAEAIMTTQNANDDEPERFEAAHLATVALEAAAPAIRAPAERHVISAARGEHLARQRIAELEQHVAVLEVRHSEADELVRAGERERLRQAVTTMRDRADDLAASPAASTEVSEDSFAESGAYDSVLDLLAGDS